MAWKRGKFSAILAILQVAILVLFALFVEYEDSANARHPSHSRDASKGGSDPNANDVQKLYPMFQDVHVMIFVGFGFLMTFLKRYGFSAVGINFLIGAFVLQWAILLSGFFHLHHGKIQIGIANLLSADFAAAAVLITFGAVLGKTSPLQMILIAVIEIVIFTANEYVGVNKLKVADIGGSMFVHVFGAYFGLALSRMIYKKETEDSDKEGSIYHSDIFAMIGTIFLWLFWPSFNSALAPGDDKHRAVINTYLALASCCVVSFIISSAVDGEDKFDMVHVQNATLAGGVAVGTSADMMIQPWGALLIGCVAAALSVIGYKYITPFLNSKLKIHDTCGVNNLHGMPGIMAAIAGAVATALASEKDYGHSLYQIFPARAPLTNSSELKMINSNLTIDAGWGRSAGQQAGFQMVALLMTLGVALVGGALTGLLMRLPIFNQPRNESIFDDSPNWETPDDFVEHEEIKAGNVYKPSRLVNDYTASSKV